jgi:hypothetical protein
MIEAVWGQWIAFTKNGNNTSKNLEWVGACVMEDGASGISMSK